MHAKEVTLLTLLLRPEGGSGGTNILREGPARCQAQREELHEGAGRSRGWSAVTGRDGAVAGAILIAKKAIVEGFSAEDSHGLIYVL